jgi:N-acetylmuramoyl-L-alanine amidase
MLIALFPGHVGKDSGAIDPTGPGDRLNTVEAAVTAGITGKISMLLKLLGLDHIYAAGGWDYRIIATKACNLGVEIHADICSNENAGGFHVIHHPSSAKGKELAACIDRALGLNLTRARDPHSARLKILTDTGFPVVVVECGFLSNTIDEALLLNEEHQYNIAFAVVQGIREFVYKQTGKGSGK